MRHIHVFLSESPDLPFASTVQPLDTEWAWREWFGCSKLLSSDNRHRWLANTRCRFLYAVRFAGRKLIAENNTEKRAVDFQPTVVVNKSQFSEPVHEKTHSRAGRANHFR